MASTEGFSGENGYSPEKIKEIEQLLLKKDFSVLHKENGDLKSYAEIVGILRQIGISHGKSDKEIDFDIDSSMGFYEHYPEHHERVAGEVAWRLQGEGKGKTLPERSAEANASAPKDESADRKLDRIESKVDAIDEKLDDVTHSKQEIVAHFESITQEEFVRMYRENASEILTYLDTQKKDLTKLIRRKKYRIKDIETHPETQGDYASLAQAEKSLKSFVKLGAVNSAVIASRQTELHEFTKRVNALMVRIDAMPLRDAEAVSSTETEKAEKPEAAPEPVAKPAQAPVTKRMPQNAAEAVSSAKEDQFNLGPSAGEDDDVITREKARLQAAQNPSQNSGGSSHGGGKGTGGNGGGNEGGGGDDGDDPSDKFKKIDQAGGALNEVWGHEKKDTESAPQSVASNEDVAADDEVKARQAAEAELLKVGYGWPINPNQYSAKATYLSPEQKLMQDGYGGTVVATVPSFDKAGEGATPTPVAESAPEPEPKVENLERTAWKEARAEWRSAESEYKNALEVHERSLAERSLFAKMWKKGEEKSLDFQNAEKRYQDARLTYRDALRSALERRFSDGDKTKSERDSKGGIVENGKVTTSLTSYLEEKGIQRSLANRLVLQPAHMEKEMREKIVLEKHPNGTVFARTLEVMRKNRNLSMATRVLGYGVLGAMSGGVGGFVAGAGAQMARIGLGMIGGMAAGGVTSAVLDKVLVAKAADRMNSAKEGAANSIFTGNVDSLTSDIAKTERQYDRAVTTRRVASSAAAVLGGYGAASLSDVIPGVPKSPDEPVKPAEPEPNPPLDPVNPLEPVLPQPPADSYESINEGIQVPPELVPHIDDLGEKSDTYESIQDQIRVPDGVIPRIEDLENEGDTYESLNEKISVPDEVIPRLEDGEIVSYTVQAGDNAWNIMEAEGKNPEIHSKVLFEIPEEFRNKALDSLFDLMEKDKAFTESAGIPSGDPHLVYPGDTLNISVLDSKLAEIAIEEGWIIAPSVAPAAAEGVSSISETPVSVGYAATALDAAPAGAVLAGVSAVQAMRPGRRSESTPRVLGTEVFQNPADREEITLPPQTVAQESVVQNEVAEEVIPEEAPREEAEEESPEETETKKEGSESKDANVDALSAEVADIAVQKEVEAIIAATESEKRSIFDIFGGAKHTEGSYKLMSEIPFTEIINIQKMDERAGALELARRGITEDGWNVWVNKINEFGKEVAINDMNETLGAYIERVAKTNVENINTK